mmetsp:Transcript_6621/g.14430  ORF Transcript_6621/g.14430 Transcript_6621/m.14430 type:complete len:204 (-) Transcript_6621:902-1513(-)
MQGFLGCTRLFLRSRPRLFGPSSGGHQLPMSLQTLQSVQAGSRSDGQRPPVPLLVHGQQEAAEVPRISGPQRTKLAVLPDDRGSQSFHGLQPGRIQSNLDRMGAKLFDAGASEGAEIFGIRPSSSEALALLNRARYFVVGIQLTLSDRQQGAVVKCCSTQCRGIGHFQRVDQYRAKVSGASDLLSIIACSHVDGSDHLINLLA